MVAAVSAVLTVGTFSGFTNPPSANALTVPTTQISDLTPPNVESHSKFRIPKMSRRLYDQMAR
jgi:hypothetical protein